jgi:L-fuculose-phosphate aldolase
MKTDTRNALIDICQRMYDRGHVAAYQGNASCLLDEQSVLVTPTRVCKGDIEPSDLVTVDRSGRRIGGTRNPTSELETHLMIYDARGDVRAVVHGHPPAATGFAAAGIPLPERALPELIVSIGRVPLVPYGMSSSRELTDAIRPLVAAANVFLLENHGVLAVGTTVQEAYFRLEGVEQAARVILAARALGGVKELTEAQVQSLLGLRNGRRE